MCLHHRQCLPLVNPFQAALSTVALTLCHQRAAHKVGNFSKIKTLNNPNIKFTFFILKHPTKKEYSYQYTTKEFPSYINITFTYAFNDLSSSKKQHALYRCTWQFQYQNIRVIAWKRHSTEDYTIWGRPRTVGKDPVKLSIPGIVW